MQNGKFGNKNINLMFKNIYQNKNVLITGHTGFKGSWLVAFLKKLGANVIGFALEPQTNPNHFSLLNPDIISEIGDIRDKNSVNQIIKKYQPEIVFHLAAQALVRKSYFNPIETLETNIIGTANIFEACKNQKSVKAIVNITSDKCYENRETEKPYIETDILGGFDIYSASKACSEIITNSYTNSFFNIEKYKTEHNILIATMRAGNVIGGGDWADDRIIPDIMRSIEKGEELIIRNPMSTRPWQHVLEPLAAYLLIGQKLLEEKKEFAKAWNVADINNEVHSVKELVDIIKFKWNKFNFSESKTENLHEAKMLLLDSSALNKQTGWQNIWNFNETIQNTIDWYKEFYDNKTLLTKFQLNKYIDYAKKQNAVWIN
jgi:CDP-glucose 4,6-dehydratase